MVYTVVLVILVMMYCFSKTLPLDRRRKFYLFFCFLILGLLAGFRYEEQFSDFQVNYKRVIQAYDMNWYEVLNFSSEVLHQILRKLIAIIFKDPQWYFILSSAFIIGAFMINAYKYSDDPFLYTLLFYCVFVFFQANNNTRQCIAVALTLYSWDYLIKSKKLQFACVMFAAVLVHSSAFIFIPLYFLSYKKITRNSLIGYFFVGTIIVVFSTPIIKFIQRFVYSDYVEGAYGTTGSNPLRLILAVLTIFAMCLLVSYDKAETNVTDFNDNAIETTKKQAINDRYINFIFHGSFFFIICNILSAVQMLIFDRLSLYFCPCVMICIIKGIKSQENKKFHFLIRFCIILFAISWFAAMNYAGKLIPSPYYPFWEFPTRIKIN